MTSLSKYPSRIAHTRAWEELSQAIADNADAITATIPTTSPNLGELTIIGSGIETVGFTLGDENLIRAADAVFYCVADPSTVVWIKSLRPDAYDLYVLYDDSKVRYTTYMQMTEAMLHFVRRGKKVVAIFYGHPGIFVLSTHRAILIAKREGHKAVMRAGVCALDCLCADLGVDPCHPGMQTHEATDMLIRGRIPDASLHVVLWQVGLIGEMGFRRKGYINKNFSILIEYLQKYYGQDYPITHYIASRYPTIEPLIEIYPLSALHEPNNQERINGISTFYIPPKDNTIANREMLYRLGLLKPGQEVYTNVGPIREIGNYGQRERQAFKAFKQFKIPKDYQWQEDTVASRFLIALRENVDLRQAYINNPSETLSVSQFPDLSDRERALLITRDAGAIQVAARGLALASAVNRNFLKMLYQKKPLQLSLLKQLRYTTADNLIASLQNWSTVNNCPADWERMRIDIDLSLRDCLFPWAGIYSTQQTGEGLSDNNRLIVITGDGTKARLSVDGNLVQYFAFKRGVLEWKQSSGALENGYLRVDINNKGQRRLLGSIWSDQQTIPAEHRLQLDEVVPGRQHPALLLGTYIREVNGKTEQLEIAIVQSASLGRFLGALLNGQLLTGSLQLKGQILTVGEQQFLLPGHHMSSAYTELLPTWQKTSTLPSALCGIYQVRLSGNEHFILTVEQESILIDNKKPDSITISSAQISWSGGTNKAISAHLHLLLDPITLFPFLFGVVENHTEKSVRCQGFISPPTDKLKRIEPELGLNKVLWQHLLASLTNTDKAADIMLWYQVEKANLAALIVNTMLSKQLP